MNWNAFHHRGDVLRSVVDEANLRRDGALPWHLPGVPETFHDELDLVAALQLRWYTRLTGQIERHLQAEPMDLESAVRRAWLATAEDMPGVRAVLDRQVAHPSTPEIEQALARATATELAMLAMTAGRGGAASGRRDPRAVAAGREIVEAARASYRPAMPMPDPGATTVVRESAAASLAPARARTTPVETTPAETTPVEAVLVEAAAVEPVSEEPLVERVPSGSAAFVARIRAALAA